jgi:hypothetical protein
MPQGRRGIGFGCDEVPLEVAATLEMLSGPLTPC